jgi:hypothetical protein
MRVLKVKLIVEAGYEKFSRYRDRKTCLTACYV